MVMDAKLKPGIWVPAQVRLCDAKFLSAYVRKKGDPDGGAVLLRLDRLNGTSEVFTQARGLDGRLGWMRGVGDGAVPDAEVESYIQGELSFDPDLWVLEIEDPDEQYELDGGLLT